MALQQEYKEIHKAFRTFLKVEKGQSGIYLNTLIKAVEEFLPALIRERVNPIFKHPYAESTDIFSLCKFKSTIEENPDWAVDSRVYSSLEALNYYIEYKAAAEEIDLTRVLPNTAQQEQNYDEGRIYESHCTRRERDRDAREACIREKGCKCAICGFDFEAKYGEAGKGFIEVHHLNPLSNTDGEHSIKSNELIPICSNCHSIIHRKKPDGINNPFTIDEMKKILGLQNE